MRPLHINNKLVSVIVPMYNAETTICRCVDSILSQTYRNIEVILIDDGSKDATLSIAEDYTQRDIRVKAYAKKNGGVSSARNFGLENASGGGIIFIDSDDYIKSDYIENLTGILADIVLCGHIHSERTFHYPCLFVNGKQDIGKVLHKWLANAPVGVPWGKIFNREIIEKYNIRFDETLKVGEDHVFTQNYLMHCNSLAMIEYSGYYYSIDTHPNIKKYILSDIESMNFLNKVIGTYNELKKEFNFENEKFYCQNVLFPLFKYLDYQSVNYPYSISGIDKAVRFLTTIELPINASSYINGIIYKLSFLLIIKKQLKAVVILHRFIIPIIRKIKSL